MGLGQLIMAGVGTGVCETAKVHSGQAALGRWGVHDALKCFSSSSEVELLTSKGDGAGDVRFLPTGFIVSLGQLLPQRCFGGLVQNPTNIDESVRPLGCTPFLVL